MSRAIKPLGNNRARKRLEIIFLFIPIKLKRLKKLVLRIMWMRKGFRLVNTNMPNRNYTEE